MQTKFHLWLARIISYEEHALAILNGPALKWAAVVTAFAVSLPQLASIPVVTYIWICLVLIGVDVQYIACVRQAAETNGHTRFWWIVVAVLLFFPVVQTNSIFSLHTQTGMSELEAMGMIHLSPTGWALERAFLLALLMAVSALSRPRQHTSIPAPVVAPTPAPTSPPPGKGKRSGRRDIGRTVEETEALKDSIRPKVLALTAGGHPQAIIADMLGVTRFMVQQIVKEDRIKRQAKKGA